MRTLRGHRDEINNIKPLKGSLIASSSHDGTIRVLDVLSGECLRAIDAPYFMRTIEVLNENLLIGATLRGLIQVWDLQTNSDKWHLFGDDRIFVIKAVNLNI